MTLAPEAGALEALATPVDADGDRHVSGAAKIVLLVSLGVVFFVLLTLYAAVLGVLLPNQIQNIDASAKTKALGIVFAITSVFSTLATPIAGALSDRTRTRFGRRTPWIVIGATLGGASLMVVPHMGGSPESLCSGLSQR